MQPTDVTRLLEQQLHSIAAVVQALLDVIVGVKVREIEILNRAVDLTRRPTVHPPSFAKPDNSEHACSTFRAQRQIAGSSTRWSARIQAKLWLWRLFTSPPQSRSFANTVLQTHSPPNARPLSSETNVAPWNLPRNFRPISLAGSPQANAKMWKAGICIELAYRIELHTAST